MIHQSIGVVYVDALNNCVYLFQFWNARGAGDEFLMCVVASSGADGLTDIRVNIEVVNINNGNCLVRKEMMHPVPKEDLTYSNLVVCGNVIRVARQTFADLQALARIEIMFE